MLLHSSPMPQLKGALTVVAGGFGPMTEFQDAPI